jgi:hypothetical protein
MSFSFAQGVCWFRAKTVAALCMSAANLAARLFSRNKEDGPMFVSGAASVLSSVEQRDY